MTADRLLDKVAIVTGAGSNIGRGIAERFAAEGASVVVAEIDEESGQETVTNIEESGGRAELVTTDVTDGDQVDAMVEATVDEFGSLDVLVNNAGGNLADDNLHRIDEEIWARNLALNLTGKFLCARRALPAMVDSGGGNMIHLSSVNAFEGIGLTAYTAAKGGVRSFSKLIANHYGRHGIRSNVISPGTITEDANELYDSEEIEAEWIEQYPAGRLGRPEDIANAALYLASDEASFVTGAELVVDGGFSSGPDQQLQRLVNGIDERPTLE